MEQPFKMFKMTHLAKAAGVQYTKLNQAFIFNNIGQLKTAERQEIYAQAEKELQKLKTFLEV